MQGYIIETGLTYHPCLTPQPSARMHLSQYLTEVGDHSTVFMHLLKSTNGDPGPPPTRLPADPFHKSGRLTAATACLGTVNLTVHSR